MDKDTEVKTEMNRTLNLSDMDEETIAILLDDKIAPGG